MAVTLNLLAAIDNPGYFEGDLAKQNPFRDEVGGLPYKLDAEGCVRPSEKPGLGLEVDEGRDADTEPMVCLNSRNLEIHEVLAG